MSDVVTEVTMWKDQFGQPFATEADAIRSNEQTDLKAFLESQAGAVDGLDGCNLLQLATVLLNGYDMTPAA